MIVLAVPFNVIGVTLGACCFWLLACNFFKVKASIILLAQA